MASGRNALARELQLRERGVAYRLAKLLDGAHAVLMDQSPIV